MGGGWQTAASDLGHVPAIAESKLGLTGAALLGRTGFDSPAAVKTADPVYWLIVRLHSSQSKLRISPKEKGPMATDAEIAKTQQILRFKGPIEGCRALVVG